MELPPFRALAIAKAPHEVLELWPRHPRALDSDLHGCIQLNCLPEYAPGTPNLLLSDDSGVAKAPVAEEAVLTLLQKSYHILPLSQYRNAQAEQAESQHRKEKTGKAVSTQLLTNYHQRSPSNNEKISPDRGEPSLEQGPPCW